MDEVSTALLVSRLLKHRLADMSPSAKWARTFQSTYTAWYCETRYMLSTMQAWLQRFAWTEKKLERRKKLRNSLPADRTLLEQETMFCFETAVKLLYWCGFVYQHDETEMQVCSMFLLCLCLLF